MKTTTRTTVANYAAASDVNARDEFRVWLASLPPAMTMLGAWSVCRDPRSLAIMMRDAAASEEEMVIVARTVAQTTRAYDDKHPATAATIVSKRALDVAFGLKGVGCHGFTAEELDNYGSRTFVSVNLSLRAHAHAEGGGVASAAAHERLADAIRAAVPCPFAAE